MFTKAKSIRCGSQKCYYNISSQFQSYADGVRLLIACIRIDYEMKIHTLLYCWNLFTKFSSYWLWRENWFLTFVTLVGLIDQISNILLLSIFEADKYVNKFGSRFYCMTQEVSIVLSTKMLLTKISHVPLIFRCKNTTVWYFICLYLTWVTGDPLKFYKLLINW